MRLIKRYPNRKLYDTEDKRYVTLNGIAELIRAGHEVQVIDHATGEDLTAVTLTQIIFEQEKQQAGFLPRSVLTGLIQAGGERLSTLRRTLASPLDLFHHVDEEIEERLRVLIQRGELAEDEAMSLRDMLLSQGQQRRQRYLSRLNEDELARLLAEHGVPSRAEVEELEMRLELLMEKLDAMLVDTEAGTDG
jgi:polyhydroxyalkanoate synthesis repressor PhaR